MHKLGELSDTEINNHLKGYKLYKGCFGCLELSHIAIEKGVYIVNIDRDPHGQGTHWTLVSNLDPNRIIYFDSYGQVPNSNIYDFMTKANKPMFYNTTDYQAIRSQACGYYCIYVAQQLLKNRKFEDVMNDFIPQHGNDTSRNEKYLQSYFVF
jgi:hypothetical protein